MALCQLSGYGNRDRGRPRLPRALHPHYLGRYTHKSAIANHRLVDFDGEKVRFRWRGNPFGHAPQDRKDPIHSGSGGCNHWQPPGAMSLGECHPLCSKFSPILGTRDIAKLAYPRNPHQRRRTPQRHVLRYVHGRWCRTAKSRQQGRILVLRQGVLRNRDSGSGSLGERFPDNAACSSHRYGRQPVEAVVSGDRGIEYTRFLPESLWGFDVLPAAWCGSCTSRRTRRCFNETVNVPSLSAPSRCC